MSDPDSSSVTISLEPKPKKRIPLYLQVLLGVGIGILLGVVFEKRPYLGGITNEALGQIGLLAVRMLKTLATPLIFFAILDSFIATRITLRRGLRLILICLLNVSVAMCIGLAIMNTFRPGEAWKGHITDLLGQMKSVGASTPKLPTPSDTKPTLDPLKNLSAYVPENVIDPFQKNTVISIVLLALLMGAALRHVKERQKHSGETSLQTVERFVQGMYQILIQMLTYIVHIIPIAVMFVVADVVGRSGLEVFRLLSGFLFFILLGLFLHALLYYPFVAWAMGRKSPKVFFGRGVDAILTGLSMNSSLATVPITLRCLKKMGVSTQSARLSACVGTNLNNDGIMLYEAMTAVFLAQALGYSLGLSQQLTIVFASIMAGAGIAGIPEAGLIVLPLVLSAAGLPGEMITPVLALIFPVDWIIARCRSGVNVMGDMTVAIQLDRTMNEADRLALLEEVEEPTA
jgi:DAACS family dicarboxylate/amino acid:cation (Na+ or H+) symporter